MENVLEVKNIEKYYGNKSNLTKAIDNISFNVKNGEFVGIMGASGSGKTTLLNCVSTIDRVTAGHIIINGEDITKLKGNKLNKFRREELGFIFQDFNLLDTLTIYENIALALTIQKVSASEINNRVPEIAKKLDISGIMNKYPYQVSGGQKQRVGIARALALNPEFIVCDEITASLDVSVQAQILNLLLDIKEERGMTYLFISHNLDIVKGMCDEVIIMYKGCIVEKAKSEELFEQPKHPYTELLLKSLPAAYPDQKKTGYETKQIIMNAEGQGCLFASRCKYAKKECRERVPQMKEIGKEHWVACHQAVQMTN